MNAGRKTHNPVQFCLLCKKVLSTCAQSCICEVWMRWWECLYLASQPISQWVISSGCLSVSLARQWAMVPPCPMAPSNPPDHCLPSCIARPRIEYVCGGAIRRTIRVCVRMCVCVHWNVIRLCGWADYTPHSQVALSAWGWHFYWMELHTD